jgi:hypothetical protein
MVGDPRARRPFPILFRKRGPSHSTAFRVRLDDTNTQIDGVGGLTQFR